MRPSQTRGGTASTRAIGLRGWSTTWASSSATATAPAVRPPRYSQPAEPSAWLHSQPTNTTAGPASTASTMASGAGAAERIGASRARIAGSAAATAQPMSSAWARLSVPK
jgi:hypothetical protein